MAITGLAISPEIAQLLTNAARRFSRYISLYVDVLNKYIGYQRRVSTLRFERATLIKYVKKLRFLNEHLIDVEFSEWIGNDLASTAASLGTYLIRCLEILDLLNFYLTQSLRNETISKTLNENLVFSGECIVVMETTYQHYVKFTQWMLESLGLEDQDLTIEVIQFARKCAKEDEVDLEKTDDILLQEVDRVRDADEYHELLKEWDQVLLDRLQLLREDFDAESDRWQTFFEARR
ncbi:LAMI_0G05160g1_1 [Lachancea mirantina]|uniref:LAMI_0G05160g1_1 n=1 Tax=Lachancea mirantina TaxID=1230905 RepID=A0A1G4K8Q5_9SACH|nr:LAMI_0G05160g1_1 [Lachancea mirantina]